MLIPTLWSHWQHLFRGPAPELPFLELRQQYKAKGRHYHNWAHLEAMFGHLDRHSADLSELATLTWAIFYHDGVYAATRKDNEARSAAWAARVMREQGCAEVHIAEVERFILATQDHVLPKNAAPDLAFLLDFDLSILGQSWPEYETYAQSVRREYAIYPDFLYRPGRKKAMQHFLERPFIFQTSSFRGQYEAQARANIEREIRELT